MTISTETRKTMFRILYLLVSFWPQIYQLKCFQLKKTILLTFDLVRLGQKYYNWQAAAALFFSLIMFDKPIEDSKVDELQQVSLPKPGWFRSWTRTTSTSSNSSPRKAKPEPIEAEKRLERSMSDPGEFESEIRPRTNSMIRSLELTSDELKKLNLNYGENEICFWVTTMYQGIFRKI